MNKSCRYYVRIYKEIFISPQRANLYMKSRIFLYRSPNLGTALSRCSNESSGRGSRETRAGRKEEHTNDHFSSITHTQNRPAYNGPAPYELRKRTGRRLGDFTGGGVRPHLASSSALANGRALTHQRIDGKANEGPSSGRTFCSHCIRYDN